jgi:hypothetical protein
LRSGKILDKLPELLAPIDQHYVRLREELNRTFETIWPRAGLKNSQHNDNMLSCVL